MNEPTITVARCYRTPSGWFVVLRGLSHPYPIEEEVSEGAAVRIEGNRAVRA